MKRHTLFIYIASLLAMLATTMPLAAQQASQDALYIYRNDGKFHGFFYSDIERISYSNVDTLGVVHDDFVVQEIYALDSVFRIPVSAIDSVSFVTPETQYKPGVVTPESSLWDYVIASDSMTTITLSSKTPKSLVPKVGDKLANASATPYLPAGFFGKVATVNTTDAGTVVTVSRVEPTELFDRFVSKYAGRIETTEAAARSKSKRRRANDIASDYKAKENEVPLKPLLYKLDLNTGKVLGGYSIKFNDNFSVTGEGHFQFSIDPSLIVRSFFEVSQEDGTFFDMTTRLEVAIDYELEAKAQASLSADLPLPAIEFPLGYGLFGEYELGDVITLSGELAIKQNWHNVTSAYGMVQWIKGYKTDYAGSIHTLSDNWSSSLTGNLALSIGMYHQVKVKFLTGMIAEAALRFESGFKGEMSTDLTFTDLAILYKPELALLDSRSLYQKMNRDLAYKISLYGTGKIGLEAVGSMITKDFVFYDKEAPLAGQEFGIVPKFTNVIWQLDEKRPWRGMVTTHLDRKLVSPLTVGQALFERSKNEFYSSSTEDNKYGSPTDFKKYVYGYEFLQPGKNYRVYPTVGFSIPFYQTLLADKYVDFTLGPPSIKFNPGPKLEVSPYVGSKEIEVMTNMYNTDMEDPKGADWLRTSYIKDEGSLKIYYDDMPEDVDMRRASIHFIGRDSLNEKVLKEDSLVVTQLRPVIHPTPMTLEFDWKGGSKTISLTSPIDEMYAEFGYNPGDNFKMNYDPEKKIITVTVTENKGNKERSAVILITGYTAGGLKAEARVDIFQDAGKSDITTGSYVDGDNIYIAGPSGSVDITLHFKEQPQDYGRYGSYKVVPLEEKEDENGVRLYTWEAHGTLTLKDKSNPLKPVYTLYIPSGAGTYDLDIGYWYEEGGPGPFAVTTFADVRNFKVTHLVVND